MLPVTKTNYFLKNLYANAPVFEVPETKFLINTFGATDPKDKPQVPGRPSTKRKRWAMDAVARAAHPDRHPGA